MTATKRAQLVEHYARVYGALAVTESRASAHAEAVRRELLGSASRRAAAEAAHDRAFR